MLITGFHSLLAICCMILSFVYPAAPEQFIPTQSYMREEFLNFEKSMKLFWNYDDQEITFELHARTSGWLGLGISPKGGMKNADIWVGWVTNGTAVIKDRHGPSWGNFYPPLDGEQNIELLEGRECEGKTMLKFKRKLLACDVNDRTITEGTIKVIGALGRNDPRGDDITVSDMHSSRTRWTKRLILLSGTDITKQQVMENTSYFDVRNNAPSIPRQSTYYNCRLMKLPEFSTKHHVIKIEPMIEPEHHGQVHHMVVLQCPNPPRNSTNVGHNFQCYSKSSPTDITRCIDVIAAWTVGQGAFNFPKDTGFPLGAADSPQYVVLETHYDNPTLKEIRDTSALRYFYTSELRKHDTGVMTVGHLVTGFEHVIPPGTESFVTYGECNSGCMSAAMEGANVDEIKLIAVVPHSHLAGKAVALQLFRNGTELAPISKDDNYDFDYQESRIFRQERAVRKGDTLVSRCEYKTTGRSTVTLGGFSTQEEMCSNFIHYYPRIPLSSCISSPATTLRILSNRVGIKSIRRINPEKEHAYSSLRDYIITAPEHLANLTISEAVSDFPWNKTSTDWLSDQFRSTTLREICLGPGLNHSIHFFRQPTTTTNPYVEPAPQCNASVTSHTSELLSKDCAANASDP